MAGLTKLQIAMAHIEFEMKRKKPGEKMLGITTAAPMYGVGQTTVLLAYKILEGQGLLSVTNQGTFKR